MYFDIETIKWYGFSTQEISCIINSLLLENIFRKYGRI